MITGAPPIEASARRAGLVDALAERMIAQAEPVRFGLATSPGEKEAVFRLRYAVVLERGWGRPADFPDGLERDEYDADALHIVAWNDRRLVGACRLVCPRPGRPLPTEAAFGLTIEPRGRVIDAGRLCVARADRWLGAKLWGGLLARAWIELRALGFTWACSVVTPAGVRLYRRLGIRLEPLAAPRWVWGERRFPILAKPAAEADAEAGRPEA
ncbi:MAG: GNAT family N-acetyltransferase [Verrucomicrobia bacterium]|nr:GNAT family N-acetyltransferase [Verrucomicrobiota bacterium]